MDSAIRVLHVDDDVSFAELTATFLEDENDQFDVRTVSTVSEALDRIGEGEVDCIVSDYDLPGEHGIDFLETVRAGNDHIPFILYTGKGSEEIASDAISAGVTDYLQKEGGADQYAILANRISNAVRQYRSEQLAERTQQQLNEIADNANDVLWMFTGDWNELLFVNSAYEDIWGRSVASLEENPRDFLDGIHPEDRNRVERAMGRLSNGESVDIEYRVNEDEGYSRWVWVQASPLFDASGNVTRVTGFARDVTDRKAREATLQETTQRLEAVIEASPDPIAVFAEDATVELWNSAAEAVFGYTEAEVVGTRFPSLDIIPPEGVSTFETRLSRAFEGETYTGIEAERRTKEGDRVDLILSKAPVRDADGTISGVVTVKKDISEQKRLEERLRRENKRFERLLETNPVGILILDDERRIARANRRVEDVLDLSRSEILDRTYDDHEWTLIDEDGEPLSDEALPFRRVIETDSALFDSRHGIEWPDGTQRWLSVNAAPLRSEHGDTEQVIVGLMDITEQREREREITQQNERLEEFASIVSHDLRNPLNVARGHLELAQETCESDHLSSVDRAHGRMESLIGDLLMLARQGERVHETEPVALADAVERCWRNVETTAASVDVEADASIRADSSRFDQLLENLFRNAVEHGGDGVTVTVGDLDTDSGFYVADDGVGIPLDKRADVFDAGYSTSEDGTGFGLSIARQVADAHGWSIRLTGGAEGGARFEVSGVEFLRD